MHQYVSVVESIHILQLYAQLYAIFIRNIEICKNLYKDLVNDQGDIPRFGVLPLQRCLECVA